MKLVKQEVEKPLLNKRYLIPSILAMGFVPLIMHEHTYRTHLENEDWFAVGNYTATDFFLFWKQWAVIILALVCLLLLLIRAKYYYEELPWDKKAFIPLGIYCVFVFLSACFAKKPLFAFAGGYDMFQSVLAILSYAVLFYYTYSCIKSMDHVLYLLRGAEIGIAIELLICFFQAIGHDPIATTVGKILVTSPSRWKNLDSLTLASSMYGTLYNEDYLSMYLPVVIPVIAALLFLEEKFWRKIVNAGLLVLSLFVLAKASSTAKFAIVGVIIIAFLVLCARNIKTFISAVIMLAAVFFAVFSILSTGLTKVGDALYQTWNWWGQNDDEITIKQITTGNSEEGIRVDLKDGVSIRFRFSIDGDKIKNLKVYDKNNNTLKLTLADEKTQTYTFEDEKYQAENMYFVRDDSHGYTCLDFVKDGHQFPFADQQMIVGSDSDNSDGYYLISTAGRTEKLPQKNVGEVYHVFQNGFWTGRGSIYNRSFPLLKKYIIVGAGADNYIMAYPQRDYVWDYYFGGGSNSLNVKPHCYYLQLWIQEGFIAFAAVIVFFFWYFIRSTRLYKDTKKADKKIKKMGLVVMISVVAYLIAVLANDSTICTAPVFWVMLGLGWGINTINSKDNNNH